MRMKWLMVLLIMVSSLNATIATQDNVTKLYVATFDRAPEKDGINYWINSGFSLENIARSFFDQKETVEKYPEGTTVYDFISAVYLNLFDRYPDEKGKEYWAEALYNGDISPSLFILAVIGGALGDDASILENKTEVGLAFAEVGLDDIQLAKDLMTNITEDYATVTDAIIKIEDQEGSSLDTTLPANVQAVIDFHNAARAELYSGSPLTWSKSLEASAQAYANDLAQRGVFEHDANNNQYGENLAISTTDMSFEHASELWYAEKPDYDYTANSCIAGAMCGHYTQMIWKNSTEMACASAINQTGVYQGGVVVVCRYNPSGNHIGQQPY